MIFVDTGYLIAVARKGDTLHRCALAWAQAVSEPLITTDYVVCEAFNGLSRLADRPRIHALYDRITRSSSWEIVAASAQLFSRGIALDRNRTDKQWSLIDCISFIVMRDRGGRSRSIITSSRRDSRRYCDAIRSGDKPVI